MERGDLNETVLDRVASGRSTGRNVQFAVDVAEVSIDGVQADK